MRFSFLIIASVFAGLATSAQAEVCSTIDDDVKRLACFDGAFPRQTSATPVAPEETSPGEAAGAQSAKPSVWRHWSETSPVDDSNNVFLSVEGENGIQNQYGQAASIRLIIRCQENVTSAILTFGGHFMSDNTGGGRVTYRIDKQKAQSRSFGESTDHEALGLWNGGTSIPFVKAMFGGERMYVEATPYSESPVSDFLPIAGLEEQVRTLREACGW